MPASTILDLDSKVMVISKAEVRYEGIPYIINATEMALQAVRSWGTEGRKNPDIPPSSEVYDVVIFPVQEVKELIFFLGPTLGVFDFLIEILSDHYIGSKISLISHLELRVEGILHAIDTNKSILTLGSVCLFGTEGRKLPEIPPSNEIYDFMDFRHQDIKELTVLESRGGISNMDRKDSGSGGIKLQSHAQVPFPEGFLFPVYHSAKQEVSLKCGGGLIRFQPMPNSSSCPIPVEIDELDKNELANFLLM